MDVLREVFSYPFMELVHPTGRKKLVSKKGPQTGAAYGYRIDGTFMSLVSIRIANSIRLPRLGHHSGDEFFTTGRMNQTSGL